MLFDAKNLTLEHGGLDFQRVLSYIESCLERLPRYRQRVELSPILGHPVWVDGVGGAELVQALLRGNTNDVFEPPKPWQARPAPNILRSGLRVRDVGEILVEGFNDQYRGWSVDFRP